MVVKLCLLSAFAWTAMLAGCAHDSNEVSQASLEREGWTRLGQVEVSSESDQDVVAAAHLPGTYSKMCFHADGPAEIHRVAVTYDNGSVFLPEQGMTLSKANTRTLTLSESARRIEKVALVYSGGRAMRKTTVTLWVK